MSYDYDDIEGNGRSGRDSRARRSSYSGARSERPYGHSERRPSSGRSYSDELSERIVQQAMTMDRSERGSGRGQRGRGNDEKRRRGRRLRRIITMIVLEVFTLTGIFVYAAFARYESLIQRPDVDLDNIKNKELDITTTESMKGYWTIAVFGVDSRGTNVSKGTNSDVNIICNINQDTGEIRLVSVFRDSYLNLGDSANSYNKINQAYAVGGPEQALKALNKNLDLDIKNYVTFNWKAVAQGIDILGGVDIELSKAEFYYINSFITETAKVTGLPTKHLSKAGMNHLDGVQAVAYGRLRLMDTDYARTERQKKVIAQAFEKAKKADWAQLNNIMVTVFPQVATNIEVDDVIWSARNISKYHMGESTGFPMARDEKNMGKKGACVIPQTLESNVKSLHEFLFDNESYTPSSVVKNISSKISSDSGLYNAGKEWGPANTDGGVIPKPTAKAETKEETKESKETKETREKETDRYGNPIETDRDGNRVYPTDSDGNLVLPTDEDGNVTVETDSSGRPIGQTRPTRPSSESSSAGTSSSPLDETTSGVNPGNRPNGPTNSTTGYFPHPTETEESGGPGAPTQGTAPSPTSGVSPGDNTPSTTSPSPNPVTTAAPTTAPATAAGNGDVTFIGPGQ